jgi:hypothetical protein
MWSTVSHVATKISNRRSENCPVTGNSLVKVSREWKGRSQKKWLESGMKVITHEAR